MQFGKPAPLSHRALGFLSANASVLWKVPCDARDPEPVPPCGAGVASIEYALIAMSVALVVVSAIAVIGGNLNAYSSV